MPRQLQDGVRSWSAVTGIEPVQADAVQLSDLRAVLRVQGHACTDDVVVRARSRVHLGSCPVWVDPPAAQILWYVDGVPWQLASHPYTARWPLTPGDHTFQARIPHQAAVSAIIKVHIE